MERKRLLMGALVSLISVSVLVLYLKYNDGEEISEGEQIEQTSRQSVAPAAPPKPESVSVDPARSIKQPQLLRDYGSPSARAIDDIRLVDEVLSRFHTLLKNPDLLRVGSNSEIMETLTGDNPEGIEFVSPSNRFIDTEGQLLDRWGTPLFFHPNSLTDIDIRSAGPDRTMFTDDDVSLAKP